MFSGYAHVYPESFWTWYFINHLGELHQIYNFSAFGDKDANWLDLYIKRSEVKKTYTLMARCRVLSSFLNKKLSYHRYSAWCGCRSAPHKSIIYLSGVQPRPLNSDVYYLFVNITILVFTSMPNLHIHTPPLFQVELEKMAWSRWTFFGDRVPRTLDYPTVNLHPC